MKHYLKTATLFALIGTGASTAILLYYRIRHIIDGFEIWAALQSFVYIFSDISVFLFFLVLYLIQQKRTKGN